MWPSVMPAGGSGCRVRYVVSAGRSAVGRAVAIARSTTTCSALRTTTLSRRPTPAILTIRRFADHAERHFDAVRTVVDLGCGPGEITCELARRRPSVTFLGVDHSDVAIARARTHAARLGLTNVTFESGDIERFTPAGRVDLVVMFDAFHHALDANALVSRLQRSCDRFFLIEPAGTWLGQWDYRTDLDWVSIAIREIRERLEYQFGLDVPGASEERRDSSGRQTWGTRFKRRRRQGHGW